MSFSALDVVRMTIGIFFNESSCLISFRTSHPLFLGKLRSNIISLGLLVLEYFPSLFIICMASIPSGATTRLWGISVSLNASMISLTSPGLSSTNKISIGLFGLSIITKYLLIK